jgi:oligosaccharide repeat unit polymerase
MYISNPFLVSLGVFSLESTTSLEIYAVSNAMLIFGLMLFFLGTNISKPDINFPNDLRIYLKRSTITLILGVLFAIAGCAIFLLIAFGGLAALHATRAELAAGQHGNVIRTVTLYMFFPFLAAAPLLITQLSKPLQTLPWIITTAILVGNFILFRARTPFVTVLASIAIGIMLKNRVLFVYGQPTAKLFRTIRDYLSVIILVVCIFVGGIVMTFLRGSIGLGRGLSDIELGRNYLQIWLEKTFNGGDLGYQKVQRAAYTLYPDPNPYLMGQSFYRVLLMPIPRTFMPNKPLNTSRVFCGAINPALYQTGGTVPPGIVGDLYINFGYIGIFGMLAYGMVFGRERYYYFWQWLMLGGVLSWLFHLVRGEFVNSLITFVVFLMVTKALERILLPEYEVVETEQTEDLYESEDTASYS